MSKKIRYEYDAEFQRLIRIPSGELPMIISKEELIWQYLGREYESYARAIYLGQGCWESLETISESDALQMLKEWGYEADSNK